MSSKYEDMIRRFISAARSLVAELAQKAGSGISSENIAQVIRAVSRRGRLPSGAEYSFHGIGCRFEKPDGSEVDVDFGQEPSWIGFDEYRLCAFIESINPSSVPEDFDLRIKLWRDLRTELEKEQEKGNLAKIGQSGPSTLLFFLGE